MAQNNNYQQGGAQHPYPSSSMPSQPILQPALQTPRLNQRAPFPPNNNNNNNNFIDQSFYNNNNQQNPMYNQNLMPGFNQMPPNFNPNGQMMNFNQPLPPQQQQMGNFMQQQPPPMMGNNFDYQSQMPNYNQPPHMMPPNSYSNYPTQQPPPQSQHHLQPLPQQQHLPPPAPSRLKQLDHRDSNVLNMIPSNKNQRNESVAPELNSFRQEKLIKLMDLSPAPYDMM